MKYKAQIEERCRPHTAWTLYLLRHHQGACTWNSLYAEWKSGSAPVWARSHTRPQTSFVYTGESRLDLSVIARLRGQFVRDQNTVELWEMWSGVKARNQIQCVLCGGMMKRSRQGGSSARITRRVMEGVHEEFWLALRENKRGGARERESGRARGEEASRQTTRHRFCFRNWRSDTYRASWSCGCEKLWTECPRSLQMVDSKWPPTTKTAVFYIHWANIRCGNTK